MNSKNNPINDQSVITKETENQSVKKECIGIYGLKNKINNKWYVGQSAVSIQGRWDEYRRLQCTNQPKLLNALKKYGYDNFETTIIEECDSVGWILDYREMYWILTLDSVRCGYNCTGGGSSGKHFPESIQKMKDSFQRRKRSESYRTILQKCSDGGKKSKGIKRSQETKEKMRAVHKLRYQASGETRERLKRMSTNHVGRPLSDETKKKISEATNGKKISVECRKKLSESLCNFYKENSHNWIDRKHSPESCEKMSQYIWITNGEVSRRLPNSDLIPDGFWQGRTMQRKLPVEKSTGS